MSRIKKILQSWLYASAGDKNKGRSMSSWKTLKGSKDLDNAIALSHLHQVIIFKHSVRCGISAAIYAHLKDDWDLKDEIASLYYLDLIEYRSLSNEIAQRMNVWHQSPQVILIFQGKVIYHASHHSINIDRIKAELDNLSILHNI